MVIITLRCLDDIRPPLRLKVKEDENKMIASIKILLAIMMVSIVGRGDRRKLRIWL